MCLYAFNLGQVNSNVLLQVDHGGQQGKASTKHNAGQNTQKCQFIVVLLRGIKASLLLRYDYDVVYQVVIWNTIQIYPHYMP